MRKLVLLLAASMLMAGSAFAGECTHSTQDCLNYMATKSANKGWMGVEYDKHEKGFTITKVVANSPAEKAGLKVGDVVAGLNEYKFANEEGKKAAYAEMTSGNTVKLALIRDGEWTKTKLTFGKMPEDVFLTMVGKHMIDHAETKTAQAEEE